MESSDEEDDMLTIKRKDHEIQDEDGKFLSKKTLTLKDAGGGTKCPPVRRLSAISHRIMLGSQKFLTLSINILPTR